MVRATSRPCKELTDGLGAEAIIDFVGENGAVEDGVEMIQDGGFYYVIWRASSATWWAPTSTCRT